MKIVLLLSLLTSTDVYKTKPNCSPPIFYNDTQYPPNEFDAKMYKLNSQRCGKGRYTEFPCVSYFKKVGKMDYHLVCKKALFPERKI